MCTHIHNVYTNLVGQKGGCSRNNTGLKLNIRNMCIVTMLKVKHIIFKKGYSDHVLNV